MTEVIRPQVQRLLDGIRGYTLTVAEYNAIGEVAVIGVNKAHRDDVAKFGFLPEEPQLAVLEQGELPPSSFTRISGKQVTVNIYNTSIPGPTGPVGTTGATGPRGYGAGEE